MKLNKKGYMLVEIVIASVLAMSIAYYLLNLTYKFKNANEDLYQSYIYTKDKVLVTKNIMSDLEKGTVQSAVINESKSEINFSLKLLDGGVDTRKLLVSQDNNKTTIEYGKVDADENFVTNDISYYKKEFSSNLIIGDLKCEKNSDTNSITFFIPMQSIYSDEDYSIKLYAKYFEINMMGDLFSSINYNAESIDYQLFQQKEYRENIKKVSFDYYVELTNALVWWDVSEEADDSIVAWIEKDTYDLHIGARNSEEIYATKLNSFFRNMTNLESIDFKSLDTSSTIDMSHMFSGCSSLTSLVLSSFNTSEVTSMGHMFQNCSSLINLDIRDFDTSEVTNMAGMFYGCSSLTSLVLSNFDTRKVTNMQGMFQTCSNLTSLDLSGFDTKKVENMHLMFYQCSSLTSLVLSSSFDTSEVTDMGNMFQECSNLTSLDLSSFNTIKVTSMSNMFAHCSSLTSLVLSSFDTSEVTNMEHMFQNCSSLTSLNVSNFDTSKVDDMSYMFEGCSSLTSLDLNNFDTSNVTGMDSMFRNSSSLKNLDVSNFDTSKVDDMSYMFYNCNNLTSLNLGNFDTSKVTDMNYMFCECNKIITELTIKNASATYNSMFGNTATDEGAKVTVSYTSATSDLVDSMLNTKSATSNVVKGELVA